MLDIWPAPSALHSFYTKRGSFELTPMVALQAVSMGKVMKEVMVSATVRWNTR